MKNSPENLALKQTLEQCQTHAQGLRDALDDMDPLHFDTFATESLSKDNRRLLDQFAYRYTRLQDDMGSRLMPAVLRALGEDVAAMPSLDRFSRMEQLGLLASADEWNNLRQIRNQFTHDYPDSALEHDKRLLAATHAAQQLLSALALIIAKLQQRFGE